MSSLVKSNRFLCWSEGVCLTLGVVLLLAYGANRLHAEVAGAEALAEFEREASVASPPRGEREPAAPDQTLWSDSRRAAYRESLTAAGGTVLGVLTIPRLSLEVPIFEGTGEQSLNLGVGRIEGTAAMDRSGNLGIAGHRDGFFRVLKDIALGDEISVRGRAGETRYRVVETLIVEPEDVHVLDPTETATVTLVTCYPFYILGHAPRRFIVRGERISEGETPGGAPGGVTASPPAKAVTEAG